MIFKIWVFALIIKLALAYWCPLFADEMYYWVWSKHLSLSYFDHPPFISWLIKLGLPLEGFGNAVRWPAVVFGHLSILLWIQLAKKWLNENDLKLFLYLLLLNPVTGVGQIVLTPDVPLMVLWPLTLLAFFDALKTRRVGSYIAVGVFSGLGFCAKYHMVFFFPAALLWLLIDRQWSKIRFSYVLYSLLAFFVFSSPVTIWNYLNDFASFRFQLTRGLGKPWSFAWVSDYLGGQLAFIFPTIFIMAIVASISYKQLREKKWLIYMAWLLPLFFLLSSFKGRVEPNWTSTSLPALFLLAIEVHKAKKWLYITLVIWGVSIMLILSQIQYGWLPIDNSKLKTHEFVAYDRFLTYPFRYQPLYAGSYQMASTLYFKTKIPVFKLKGTHRRDHFDYMPEAMPKENTFYALLGTWNNIPDWLNNKSYKIEEVENLYPTYEVRLLKITKRLK